LRDEQTEYGPGDCDYDSGVCTPENVLDPSMDGRISYLGGRHACSLLQVGVIVTGTVYEDRILVSSA
jgi:hypothetical protein